jgi:peptidoglycan/LPS O-acetylase OafA/YrhL
MILDLIEFLRQRLKRVIQICCVILALLAGFDALLLDKGKAHTAAEYLPGFWAVFGFVSCVVIIFVSKWFGKLGITRQEDYYDQ